MDFNKVDVVGAALTALQSIAGGVAVNVFDGPYSNPGPFTYQTPATDWVKDWVVPAGARGGALYYRTLAGAGSAVPGARIQFLDSQGAVVLDTDALNQAFASLGGAASQWKAIAHWGSLLGAANGINISGTAVAPVFAFPGPPPPTVRMRCGEQAAGQVYPTGLLIVQAQWW